MECTKLASSNVIQTTALFIAGITLAGCDDTARNILSASVNSRPIATVYKIRSEQPTAQVNCYRISDNELSALTQLNHNELVDIVTIDEGLRRFQDQLWLRIYPRLTHRPSCYVNVDNLIPYS